MLKTQGMSSVQVFFARVPAHRVKPMFMAKRPREDDVVEEGIAGGRYPKRRRKATQTFYETHYREEMERHFVGEHLQDIRRAERLIQVAELALSSPQKILKGDGKAHPLLRTFVARHGFVVKAETAAEFATAAATFHKDAKKEYFHAVEDENLDDVVDDDDDAEDSASEQLKEFVKKHKYKFNASTFGSFANVLHECRALVREEQLLTICDSEDERCAGPPGPKLRAYVRVNGMDISKDTMDEFAPIVWAFRRIAKDEYIAAMAEPEDGGAALEDDEDDEDEDDDDDEEKDWVPQEEEEDDDDDEDDEDLVDEDEEDDEEEDDEDEEENEEENDENEFGEAEAQAKRHHGESIDEAIANLRELEDAANAAGNA